MKSNCGINFYAIADDIDLMSAEPYALIILYVLHQRQLYTSTVSELAPYRCPSPPVRSHYAKAAAPCRVTVHATWLVVSEVLRLRRQSVLRTAAWHGSRETWRSLIVQDYCCGFKAYSLVTQLLP